MVNRVTATEVAREAVPTRRAAFTLVELLVVMAIIGILVGITIGIAGFASRKTASSQAQTDLSVLTRALEEYRVVYGSYPYVGGGTTYEADLDDLPTAVIDAITNVPGDIEADAFPTLDPWGNPYRYRASRRTSSGSAYSMEVWSYGPDSSDDSDNITVEQQ